MHDPTMLAFEIPAPWFTLSRYRPKGSPNWGVRVHRCTNAENLGERCYPWYRPCGYTVFIAARQAHLFTLVEVWHDEPGGADSGTVCKDRHPRGPRWAWRHRAHLRWKFMPLVILRCRLERCDECHRRMWKATRFATGWDAPGVLHDECHALRHVRWQREDLLKHIAGKADWTENWRAERQVADWTEAQTKATAVEPGEQENP